MAEELFHIKSDSPVVDDLMFWTLVGHESLSNPSVYELVVLSRNDQIDGKDILGRAFDVVLDFFDADGGKHQRHCQGHAMRFMRAERAGRYASYRIVLRSWFWLLTKRTNSRILQEKKVLEVMDAVLEDSPIKRFKKVETKNVIGNHLQRRYSVQHMETDFHFISRLLEDEGIYYWYDAHDAPGTMHLSDASEIAHEPLPVKQTLPYVSFGVNDSRFEEISRWVSARSFESGKYDTRDSDFKAIGKRLGSKRDTSDDHQLSDFEEFEFPGGYFTSDDADDTAKIRGEEQIARRDRHWAITTWPDVAVGRTFKFTGSPDGSSDGEYLIGGCDFVVTHSGYEGMSATDGNAHRIGSVLLAMVAEDPSSNDIAGLLKELIDGHPALRIPARGTRSFLITVLPADMPFRPRRLTPRVTMPGPQSAIVVGPKGDELHVDQLGRVKVHFHWDRYDDSNEKSTCWVRVSQPMAGTSWGGYFMPRIGQEVIVDFLNGDPDRPIVVGRVYNDKQPIPYDSPTQSGFKTRSTPGGNSNNYNELMFEDKKGEELVNIHAERNMSTSVEANDTTDVGHDQTITVHNDRTVHTIGSETREVDKNQTTTVHVNQYNNVGKYQQNIVGSDGQFNQIAGKVDVIIGGTLNTNVTGAMTQYSASLALTTTGAEAHTVGSLSVGAAGKISMTAGGDRRDMAGGSHMMAATSGIKIVSAGDVELMSNANINATSMGSNTTVLGPNSSGYIGMSNEANMGVATSTFLGLQMGNFLGASIDNALSISMENCAGLRMGNIGALDLTLAAFDVESVGMKVVNPGAGSGAVAGVMVALSAVGGLVGAGFGAAGVAATLTQYADAAKQLRDTAAELSDMPVLQSKLLALADSADRRLRQGQGQGGAAAVGTASPPGPPPPAEAAKAAPVAPIAPKPPNSKAGGSPGGKNGD